MKTTITDHSFKKFFFEWGQSLLQLMLTELTHMQVLF